MRFNNIDAQLKLVICLFSLAAFAPYSQAQPDLPFSLKSATYRIQHKIDTTIYQATGVVFSRGNHYSLICNRHFIESDSFQPPDTIRLYLNKKLPNDDVMSGPEFRTVLLKKNGRLLTFYPSMEMIDLILIPLTNSNVNFQSNDSVYSITFDSIVRFEELSNLPRRNSIITMVGFPTKYKNLIEVSPEYLWGDFLYMDSSLIYSNVPAQSGSSGSLVIARVGKVYTLMGIHKGRKADSDVACIIPANYIISCFGQYYENIERVRSPKEQ